MMKPDVFTFILGRLMGEDWLTWQQVMERARLTGMSSPSREMVAAGAAGYLDRDGDRFRLRTTPGSPQDLTERSDMRRDAYDLEVSADLTDFETGSWVAIDTETGGLDPLTHALLSVAVVGPGIRDSFLVRDSGGLVDPEALAKNGIDTDEVERTGLSPQAAAARLSKLLHGRVIVGHNIRFDIGFIARRLYGIRPLEPAAELLKCLRLVDTYRAFREQAPGASARLQDVAQYYGLMVIDSRLHTADYDAELTSLVYSEMYRRSHL